MTTITFAGHTLRPKSGGFECILPGGMRIRVWQDGSDAKRCGWRAIVVHLGLVASNSRITVQRELDRSPESAILAALDQWRSEVRRHIYEAAQLVREAS